MSVPIGHPIARKVQAANLFTANLKRKSNLNHLAGKMPTQKDAEKGLMGPQGKSHRVQTSATYPIVRCMDLEKFAGDEVEFDFIQPVGGKPIMGGRTAEGKGRKLDFTNDRLRVNQSRYPVSAGDEMGRKRVPYVMRKLARAAAEGFMNRLQDQRTLVHLAGARGFASSVEWVVPLASDPDFNEVCINTVKAPSANRHFMVDGTDISYFKATGGEVDIDTDDKLGMNAVDGLRALIDTMELAPAPCVFEGDELANDEPIRVLLADPMAYLDFKQSGNYRELLANARTRSASAKNHPLFAGNALLWENILIVKMPMPILFRAGDPIKYCADLTSEEESTAIVPTSFGTTHAISRSLLLGSQALAQAFGRHSKSGLSYFWSEKELDHEDKLEVLVAVIDGISKIRFDIDHGAAGIQPTDNGIIALDQVVSLPNFR